MRRRGSEAKFIAKFLAQGPECDIGVLSISYISLPAVPLPADQAAEMLGALTYSLWMLAALLTVEDESFWDSKINPVQFGQLPQLQDAVAVVG